MKIPKAESIGVQLLVAVDFSDSSRRALHKASELISDSPSRLLLLHVIDQRFVNECLRHRIGSVEQIKKQLFIEAKSQLKKFLQEEGFDGGDVKTLVCEGVPHVEIAKHAEKFKVDLIVMGSRGMAGNPDAIFFGGTAEKVVRFISRPILCIPPSPEE
jgi:nucleotide-binding universal stress UspA family protein